ncbi:site-specific DNA-methyltransferase [Staphylococcus haemolyticus]|uniref:site-specific DNA-methyltransferase n=1 Tax=Staphylococcaceae TaxID=90964 RepID=UPI000D1E0CC5|nr:site-specific DNA-methyltransferase [Staphylococcus haemolyticus]PTK87674.1 site-specific DNA-methyltransferase [Staphylococcus haemolyticus]
MNKIPSSSSDLTKENIEKLKELFPEILTDGEQIDFDKLKTILGQKVNGEKERYSFNWHGKKDAILGAQKPSKGTLRPDKDKSKNFDTTENLYIEGDNLEVLKLLQKSYSNKIKMIYIDPPYNTGKDFVYKDNFRDGIENYLEQTGQTDGEGNRLSTNSESNGRFHTDWLNMMYPRLKLARNLLTDDGVIFISIDDNEYDKLKIICDEIFGEENYLETLHIQVRFDNKSLTEKDDFQKLIEYTLIYKKKDFKPARPYEEYSLEKFQYEIVEKSSGKIEEIGNKKVEIFYENDYEIKKIKPSINGLKETWASGTVLKGNTSGKFFDQYLSNRTAIDGYKVLYKVYGIGDDGLNYRYFTGPKEQKYTKGKFYSGVPLGRKSELEAGGSRKYKPIINFYNYAPDFGNISHEGGVTFRSGKKPVKFLKGLIDMINDKEFIGLDFFSGSASFGHAIMQKNLEDDGNRKFILCQLPEKIDENSDYYKLGFENICDLAQTRLNNVLKETENSFEKKKGFKVLKLDKSNIREWNSDFEDLEDNLFAYEDVFVEDRSELDVVYEIMLKNGLELTYNVNQFEHEGKNVYDIAYGNLFVCLADNIDVSVAQIIVEKRNEYGTDTSSVVLKDAGFKSDADKLNVIELLKDSGYPEENILTI